MVVAKPSAYEEFRLKRLEENKKRMEALNLPHLSHALHSTSPKTSPMKKSKPRTPEKQLVAVRRSIRLANISSPAQKEAKQVVVQRVQINRRICKGRDFSNRVYATEESRADALAKAEKLQAELGDEYPSFVRSMLQSHVSGGFWLGLPVHFCKSHLPKDDGVMTLIDEDGEEYETIHKAKRTALSGGWMGFAVAHTLADGDALVFQLVRPTAFKVYITRASSSGESQKL